MSQPTQKRLKQLLDYIQHMVRLPERATLSLREYGRFVYLQENLQNREGIEFDTHDSRGPIWLRIQRLQKTPAPEPKDDLKAWITRYKNPFREPTLEDSRVEQMTKKEARALVKEAKIAPEDMSATQKPGEDLVEVTFRRTKNPRIRRAFKSYLDSTWAPWAQTERPVRETIKLYHDFFTLHQSCSVQAVEQPLEVVWGLGLVIWKTPAGLLRHPLIEALVEVDIDPVSHSIQVRPRETETRVYLKPFMAIDNPGVPALQEEARKHFDALAAGADGNEFCPFDRSTFEPLLKMAASLLSSTAQYYPNVTGDRFDLTLPQASESLMITDTWALYARPRSDNLFVDDLERLRKAVEECDDIMSVSAAAKFAETPSAELAYTPRLVKLAGVERLPQELHSHDSAGANAEVEGESETSNSEPELFFPKEFNQAQVRVIDQLEQADGVVLQGPPGTGKTHTIANIICHYLATGRRVLVTSQGEPALKVLRDFIPEDIRHLTISLLTKDHEGLEQLEAAVTLLANEVSRIEPSRIETQILERETQLKSLRKAIAHNETQVREAAARQLDPIDDPDLGTPGVTPTEAARSLNDDADEGSEWLDPQLSPTDPEAQLTAPHVEALRSARQRLGGNLQYLGLALPDLSLIPAPDQLVEIHEEMVRVASSAEAGVGGQLDLSASNVRSRAEDVLGDLRRLQEIHNGMESLPWIKKLYLLWITRGQGATGLDLIDELLVEIQDLLGRRGVFLKTPVAIPDFGDLRGPIFEGVERASLGKKPFGVFARAKGGMQQLLSQVTVNGESPANAAAWRHVRDFMKYRVDLTHILSRWNGLAAEFEWPTLELDSESTPRQLEEYVQSIKSVRHSAAATTHKLRSELPSLVPQGMDVEQICRDDAACRRALQWMESQLAQSQLSASRRQLKGILGDLERIEGPVGESLRKFLSSHVGDAQLDGKSIATRWQKHLEEVKGVKSHQQDLETVEETCALIERAGAPEWAQRLRSEPLEEGSSDHLVPENWQSVWSRKRLRSRLHSPSDRDQLSELSQERRELEAQRKELLTELVRLRTFLGLYVNMTERAKSALVRFTAAVRHIGPGDGKVRSRRYRRDAREAMKDCYTAVPCWIMPQWRVSETIPSELGTFDLVIVDEASQSDIMALPALLRGKKILIVGDDKQVSPTAPFIEERKLIHLRDLYLTDQPFVDLLMPGSSLYDLSNAVFPGRRVMLDEHFRCVEPIVRFSFRFYPEAINPVRIPKASERLTPPLIDVYLPHGQRDYRKINHAEAQAIVDEIATLVDDPEFEGRSIGVVSLIGAPQAQYVQDMLVRRITQEQFLAHNISCGDSATFQGRERDIVFLSMVASPGRTTSQTSVVYQQRFNVALSRARDRMYLFRSVEPGQLNPNDLKAKVIQHFAQPMPSAANEVESLAELCSSPLEREFLQKIVDRGYRVTPKVSVGSTGIDFVIEGNEDRRLAIQFDGDGEGLAEWQRSWEGQKLLERVGWQFWRCWASSFIVDSDSCLESLWSTLQELGIEPLGDAPLTTTVSEQRVLGADQVPVEASYDEDDIPIILEDEVSEDEYVVAVGDRVLLNFNEEPTRYKTVAIRREGDTLEHDPANGVYDSTDSMAQALLGATTGDDIELEVDGAKRTVTVIDVEKAVTALIEEHPSMVHAQALGDAIRGELDDDSEDPEEDAALDSDRDDVEDLELTP